MVSIQIQELLKKVVSLATLSVISVSFIKKNKATSMNKIRHIIPINKCNMVRYIKLYDWIGGGIHGTSVKIQMLAEMMLIY